VPNLLNSLHAGVVNSRGMMRSQGLALMLMQLKSRVFLIEGDFPGIPVHDSKGPQLSPRQVSVRMG
jgi:hypothetical protein